jgi:hypothetical protein
MHETSPPVEIARGRSVNPTRLGTSGPGIVPSQTRHCDNWTNLTVHVLSTL